MPDAARERQLLALTEAIGFSFHNLGHLDRALTHSSYANENPGAETVDNERLEYLGDAILGFLVAEWLFKRYPEAQEGELTSLRVFVVRTESLARVGRELQLGQYLRMGRGEEASGGKEREANLCAAFEAFVGAIYLDRGLETTRALVGALLETRSAEIEQQRSKKNAKSYLQEYTQSVMQITPAYAIIAEHGPDHDRQFVARVMVGNETWGEGSGRSKQAAEQAAAAAAIEQRAL